MTHARIVPRSSDTVTGASRAEFVSDSGCFTGHFASGAGRGAKRVPPCGGGRRGRGAQIRGAGPPPSAQGGGGGGVRALPIFFVRPRRAGVCGVSRPPPR